jgi:phosphatidate cytidylyltransferase
MHPFDAVASLAFWLYSGITAALLAGVWGLLFWWQRRGQRVDEYRRVFWSYVVLAGVSIVAIFLGEEVFAVVVAMAALFACKEFARATGLYEDWMFTGLVYLAIIGVNAVALWPGYDGFMATPIYAVALFCLLPVSRNQSEGMLQRVALSVMAFVYFGYFLAHLSLLAGRSGLAGFPVDAVYPTLFFVLFGTASAELAGWLVHRQLGRHPVVARITPDTTWEGLAASLAWAIVWCFSLGWALPQFGWIAMLIAAFLFGIMGPLGDLVMRYVLRDLGLKAPTERTEHVPYLALGHLNRLIFVAPLFFRLIHVLHRPV